MGAMTTPVTAATRTTAAIVDHRTTRPAAMNLSFMPHPAFPRWEARGPSSDGNKMGTPVQCTSDPARSLPVPVDPAVTWADGPSGTVACIVVSAGDRSSKPVSGVPRRWRVRFPSASATSAAPRSGEGPICPGPAAAATVRWRSISEMPWHEGRRGVQ
jgi:hypothetical protein